MLTSRLRLFAATVVAFAIAALPRSAPLAAASRCEVTGASRIVAIGDVHGAVDRFAELLQTLGLIDDRQRWTGGTAHLVQTGDVVDRGPDSRKALDLLRRLSTEAERAGGAVHALLGNHEVARMLGDLRFAVPGEYEAFTTPDSPSMRDAYIRTAKSDQRDQMRKETPLGLVEMRVAFGREGSYGEWLRKQPVTVKINGIVFLHGGISPAVAELSCDQINSTVRSELTDRLDKTRAAPLATLAAREDGPLWYRGLAQLPDANGAQLDDTLRKQHATAIVVGHTVTSDARIRMRFDGKLFLIDTGMQPAYVPAGRASALEIRGGTFTAIYQDRQDVLLTTDHAPR